MRLSLDVSAVPVHVAGAGRYVVEIARRLPEQGIDTTLVTRRGDTQRWREVSPNSSIAPVVPDGRIARLAYEAWRLGSSTVSTTADVWHAPHYTMPHGRRGATVVTIHDLTFFTNPEWHTASKAPFFRRAIQYAAHHADVLVSVSDYTSRLLDELIPGHAPVVVAPHGVDLTVFSPDASSDEALFHSQRLPWGTPYVFFVGTFEPRKGLDLLLQAFADIATEDPNVELWLAGQSGWGVEELERQLREHPAASRIRRLGFVLDDVLPALLRQSRCVAYPSRGEGFGLPVLEAMACGSLVVTTQDTVMAEVAGGAAELCRLGDSGDLARAVTVQLRRTGDERTAAARRGRSRAELFTWDASITKHLSAYDAARARS